jgi:hypothetical protein
VLAAALVERSITAERLVAELEQVFAAAGGPPRNGKVGLSFIPRPAPGCGTTVTSNHSTTGSGRSVSTATGLTPIG